MAEPGYVDVTTSVKKKDSEEFIKVEAMPLPAGYSDDYVFKKYPLIVMKPVYIPFVDQHEYNAADTNKRVIAYLKGILVEKEARQPLDVFAFEVVRGNHEGETYEWASYMVMFENITYKDLTEIAALIMRYEPDNLVMDEGRYPAIQALLPTPDRIKEQQAAAAKLVAAKQKNPQLFAPRQPRMFAGEDAGSGGRHAAASGTSPEIVPGDESWL